MAGEVSWKSSSGGGRLGKRRSLPETDSIPSGLISSEFLAVASSLEVLTRVPAAPTSRSFLTSRAAITSPGAGGRNQSSQPLSRQRWQPGCQRRDRDGRPDTNAGETESGPREGLLPSGQAAGSWNFPPPLARRWIAPSSATERHAHPRLAALNHTCQRLRKTGRESQSCDRPITEWLNWLCENGSASGCC